VDVIVSLKIYVQMQTFGNNKCGFIWK
jgi:hypothetical protein